MYALYRVVKTTSPNFGGHFDLFPEKKIFFLLAIKANLFGINCHNLNDIAFINQPVQWDFPQLRVQNKPFSKKKGFILC